MIDQRIIVGVGSAGIAALVAVAALRGVPVEDQTQETRTAALADAGYTRSGPGVERSETAGAESCNGLDDNHNGVADEWWPVGARCDGSDDGGVRCGRWVCTEDHAGVVCAGDGPPSVEVLGNGIDDDCDGHTDERR